MSNNEAVYWGTVLEQPLLNRFNKEMKKKYVGDEPAWPFDSNCAHVDGKYTLHQHPTRDWMVCTPDAKTKYGVIELKTTSYQDPDEWIADPPKHYYAQLQHNIEVMEKKYGYLVCLFMDKREFRYAKFKRNNSFIKTMVEAERKFFDRITNDEWPDVDNSDSTGSTIKKLFPLGDEEKEIEVDNKFMEAWDARQGQKEAIKFAEIQIKDTENLIKSEMKDAAFANLPDGRRISYKTINRKGYIPNPVLPTSYRQLREVKQK